MMAIDLGLGYGFSLPLEVPGLPKLQSTGPYLASDTFYEDGSAVFCGDFIVDRGSTVSLDNYTLTFNCAYDGQYKLEVLDGGTLLINGSSIRSLDGEHSYLFQVQRGGRLVMTDSSLSGCGFSGSDPRSMGLWLGSEGNTLTGNDISNNYYGIIAGGNNSRIVDNTITSSHGGLRVVSEGNIVTGNVLSGNGEGLLLCDASDCIVVGNCIENNSGYGILMANVSSGLVTDNNVLSNAYGLYAINTTRGVLRNNTFNHNLNDGVFADNSKSLVFVGNNASFNGGYGYNVTTDNDRVEVNKNFNSATGNIKGDYLLQPGRLSYTEVSLVSLLIAFADKLIYLVDFQKVIITNVFSGIVNPMRGPLSDGLDRLSERFFAAFPVKRRGYRKAHVSSHMDSLFFHLINGKDIRGIVRPGAPGRLLSHEIILQQVRFFDVLFKDRVILIRNALYMAIMMAAGIAIYSIQVSIGTFAWPYFIPLAIQFMVMFPIGLAVQGNVVGRLEKLEYDIKDEASADMLRDDVRKKITALDERLRNKKVPASKYEVEMKTLAGALRAIDYMDVRRHYLLFTPAGYVNAIHGFEALMRTSPDETMFLACAAEAYAMMGRSMEINGEDGKGYYEKARAASQKAFGLSPNSYEARRALARSDYCAGNLDGARKEAGEALKLRPGDAETYHILSAVAADPAEMLHLLQKAASSNGNLPIVRRDLGIYFLEHGDLRKAAAHFDFVLKANPSDPYAHYYLGRSYGMKGESQKAADEYRRALELYPGYKDAQVALAVEVAADIKS